MPPSAVTTHCSAGPVSVPKSLKPTRQVYSKAASAPAQDVSPQEVEKVFIAPFSAEDITILLQIHVLMHDRSAQVWMAYICRRSPMCLPAGTMACVLADVERLGGAGTRGSEAGVTAAQ